jgi:hypothetical protein
MEMWYLINKNEILLLDIYTRCGSVLIHLHLAHYGDLSGNLEFTAPVGTAPVYVFQAVVEESSKPWRKTVNQLR